MPTITKAPVADLVSVSNLSNKKHQAEYDAIVKGLTAEEGFKLTPEEGETGRGVAMSVGRAAKRLKIDVLARTTIGDDGKEYVSVRLTPEKKAKPAKAAKA